MVRLKFIIRSGSLVLRISEGKERYYKKVHSLLTGNPDIKYWDSRRNRQTLWGGCTDANPKLLLNDT